MCALLSALENDQPLNNDNIEDLQRFIQIVMYNGKSSESYIKTRIRLYENQKIKTSTSLPPDPDSLLQDLKRKQFQVNIWKQLDKVWMTLVDPKLYGWKFCEISKLLVPVWFTGSQLPPCLQKKRNSKKKIYPK